MRCRCRGPRSACPTVRGVAAASERAAAAAGAGDRGPAAGAWRGPGCRRGERGQRDHGAQGRRSSWSPARIRCRSGERAGRAVDEGAPRSRIRSWPLRCWGWWSRMSGAIRCRRCGGRPSRCGTWPSELARQGHPVSAPTVGRLLRENGFSLQGTAKTLEGAQHPDRDAQFRYINEQVKAHQAAGEPVISVDAKKKEQLGQLPAAGREWRPKGDPVQVEDHSFFTAGPDVALAIPYGIYDLTADAGWVNVGVDHDTSAFAVASIRRWWQARGASRLSRRAPAADHRGRGRLQQLPLPALEGRAGGVRRRDRPGRSPSATSRPARASGTRSSTGCSPRSP